MKRMTSGGIFEDKIGYCRAVVAGGFVHVSGCVYPGTDVPEDVIAQCHGALEVIKTALADAGAEMADVVRVRYILPNADDFEPCWPLLRATFGENPPAATMISCGLIDPKYKIEIEVTALAPDA
ncbi:RidA family protein [Rhodobacteraceae bacterium S2214]|nr:RidA family protein [Rhodobacteraceae bacterium S2214]